MNGLTWLRGLIAGPPVPEDAPKPTEARSPHWPACRAAHLKLYPTCAVCGGKDNVQAHHVRPYHLFPELELVESNLLTLCESPGANHHFWWGHLGDWKAYNPWVRKDVADWRAKILGRVYTREAG